MVHAVLWQVSVCVVASLMSVDLHTLHCVVFTVWHSLKCIVAILGMRGGTFHACWSSYVSLWFSNYGTADGALWQVWECVVASFTSADFLRFLVLFALRVCCGKFHVL